MRPPPGGCRRTFAPKACRPRRARQIAPKRAIEQFSLSREKNQTKTPRDAGRFAFLRYRGAENPAPGDRHVGARVLAGLELPRAAAIELRVFLLLSPLLAPADGPGDGHKPPGIG